MNLRGMHNIDPVKTEINFMMLWCNSSYEKLTFEEMEDKSAYKIYQEIDPKLSQNYELDNTWASGQYCVNVHMALKCKDDVKYVEDVFTTGVSLPEEEVMEEAIALKIQDLYGANNWHVLASSLYFNSLSRLHTSIVEDGQKVKRFLQVFRPSDRHGSREAMSSFAFLQAVTVRDRIREVFNVAHCVMFCRGADVLNEYVVFLMKKATDGSALYDSIMEASDEHCYLYEAFYCWEHIDNYLSLLIKMQYLHCIPFFIERDGFAQHCLFDGKKNCYCCPGFYFFKNVVFPHEKHVDYPGLGITGLVMSENSLIDVKQNPFCHVTDEDIHNYFMSMPEDDVSFLDISNIEPKDWCSKDDEICRELRTIIFYKVVRLQVVQSILGQEKGRAFFLSHSLEYIDQWIMKQCLQPLFLEKMLNIDVGCEMFLLGLKEMQEYWRSSGGSDPFFLPIGYYFQRCVLVMVMRYLQMHGIRPFQEIREVLQQINKCKWEEDDFGDTEEHCTVAGIRKHLSARIQMDCGKSRYAPHIHMTLDFFGVVHNFQYFMTTNLSISSILFLAKPVNPAHVERKILRIFLSNNDCVFTQLIQCRKRNHMRTSDFLKTLKALLSLCSRSRNQYVLLRRTLSAEEIIYYGNEAMGEWHKDMFYVYDLVHWKQLENVLLYYHNQMHARNICSFKIEEESAFLLKILSHTHLQYNYRMVGVDILF